MAAEDRTKGEDAERLERLAEFARTHGRGWDKRDNWLAENPGSPYYKTRQSWKKAVDRVLDSPHSRLDKLVADELARRRSTASRSPRFPWRKFSARRMGPPRSRTGSACSTSRSSRTKAHPPWGLGLVV